MKRNSQQPVPYAVAEDGTILHWQSFPAPGTGTHPVALIIPGGGFKNLFSIPAQVVQNLNSAGFTVFSHVEYRIAPPNKLSGQVTDGRFPDQTNDVQLAVAAAKNSSLCNGEVFVVGGSAGAAHGLWLAGIGAVKASVCLSPPTQLDDPESMYGTFESDIENYAPGHLADASPDGQLSNSSSPIYLVAFAQDHIPPNQFNLCLASLNANGIDHNSTLLSGAGHSWDAWPSVSNNVIIFLNARRGSSAPIT